MFEELGGLLREMREARGWTFDDLEHKGFDRSYLSEVERGLRKRVSLQYLWRLVRTLEAEMVDLFFRLLRVQEQQRWLLARLNERIDRVTAQGRKAEARRLLEALREGEKKLERFLGEG